MIDKIKLLVVSVTPFAFLRLLFSIGAISQDTVVRWEMNAAMGIWTINERELEACRSRFCATK